MFQHYHTFAFTLEVYVSIVCGQDQMSVFHNALCKVGVVHSQSIVSKEAGVGSPKVVMHYSLYSDIAWQGLVFYSYFSSQTAQISVAQTGDFIGATMPLDI